MKIDGEKLAGKYKTRAERYANSRKQTYKLLNEAINKLTLLIKSGQSSKIVGEAIKEFEILLSLLKDWITGEYKDIPLNSVIAVIAAIIYFVTPIDFIPDFIPGIGYLDDFAVIGVVIKQISKDLNEYKAWINSNQ